MLAFDILKNFMDKNREDSSTQWKHLVHFHVSAELCKKNVVGVEPPPVLQLTDKVLSPGLERVLPVKWNQNRSQLQLTNYEELKDQTILQNSLGSFLLYPKRSNEIHFSLALSILQGIPPFCSFD
jgi:hypothetical protein